MSNAETSPVAEPGNEKRIQCEIVKGRECLHERILKFAMLSDAPSNNN